MSAGRLKPGSVWSDRLIHEEVPVFYQDFQVAAGASALEARSDLHADDCAGGDVGVFHRTAHSAFAVAEYRGGGG